MKYIVSDTHGDEVEIEGMSEAVSVTIKAGADVLCAMLTPADVKEVQFALNRAREATEKEIQKREGSQR